MIEDVDYTASGYIQAIAPDGTVISRHRQEREAQQACFQHAKDNEDLLGDGVHDYILRSPDVRMSIRLLSVGGNPTNEDTTPPDPPAGVFNNSVTSSGFTTNWTNGPESDLQEHNVYRSSTGPSSGFSLVDTVIVPAASYSHTGLTAETQYWVYVTALDSSGNESVASSVVSSTTSAVTEGTNAARISTILNGRTPSNFSLTYPADPITTNEVTVSDATNFNFYAGQPGTKININSSFSGALNITADDIDVVMSNAATITGSVSANNGSRVSRIRWTGGNIIGGNDNFFRGVSDVLFDDVHVEGYFTIHRISGVTGCNRVAFINSTVDLSAYPIGLFCIFMFQDYSVSRHSDVIVANCDLVCGASNQASRFQYCDRFTVADTAMNITSYGGDTTGLRTGNQIQAWIVDCIAAGRWYSSDHDGNGAGMTGGVIDGLTRYRSFNGYINSDGADTGTVSNSSYFVGPSNPEIVGTPMTNYISPLTDGGGNGNVQSWDGVTLPDVSSYGAQR